MLDQTIFNMYLFIFILHINQHQVLSSKIPCLSSNQFFSNSLKNNKKFINKNRKQILISILWNHISKRNSIDPSNKMFVCRGALKQFK